MNHCEFHPSPFLLLGSWSLFHLPQIQAFSSLLHVHRRHRAAATVTTTSNYKLLISPLLISPMSLVFGVREWSWRTRVEPTQTLRQREASNQNNLDAAGNVNLNGASRQEEWRTEVRAARLTAVTLWWWLSQQRWHESLAVTPACQ